MNSVGLQLEFRRAGLDRDFAMIVSSTAALVVSDFFTYFLTPFYTLISLA